ncbi:DNA primase family protein [Streptomyces sp. NPDC001514]
MAIDTTIDPAILELLKVGLAAQGKTLEQFQAEDLLADTTEDGLAIKFRESLGSHVHFDPSAGWVIFRPGNQVWQLSQRGAAVHEAVADFLRIRRERVKGDSKEDRALRNRLGSVHMRNAVTNALAALPGVTLEPGTVAETYDRNPNLLAVRNGVIDLRTGELREGRAADCLIKYVDVDYDAESTAPRWEQFLAEVFPNDHEMPAYIRRMVGYGVTGHTKEQFFAVLHGGGANGKSVFLNVLERVFAAYSARCSFNVFLGEAKRGGPEIEPLKGARLALASETNRSAVLSTAAIKEATGGDRLTVNPKYRDAYTFLPQCLILLATNYRPQIRDADHGTWRRVKVIDFDARFDGAQRDSGLEDRLVDAEAAGILAWAVRGAVEWAAEGLADTARMRESVADYKRDSDPLDGFLESLYVLDDSAPGVLAKDVLAEYRTWASEQGEPVFKQAQTLNSALLERYPSLGKKHSKRGTVLTGIRMMTTAEQAGSSGPGIFAG